MGGKYVVRTAKYGIKYEFTCCEETKDFVFPCGETISLYDPKSLPKMSKLVSMCTHHGVNCDECDSSFGT